MIRDYTNHAANERTFLAWVRTGIAVIALGFVIEKFNLFELMIGNSTPGSTQHRTQVEVHLERLSGPLGSYGGIVLVFGGIVLIAIATMRFFHTEYLLDDSEVHSAGVGRAALIGLALLVLFVAAFSAYLTLG
jgi:putative membrane protein